MNNGRKRRTLAGATRVELSQHIVADAAICHGKPTFKGTRIMVWQVLEDVAEGRSWDFICNTRWGGRIPLAGVAEAVRLARWGLPHRQVGREVAWSGAHDTDLLPLLHDLRGTTFFTLDEDFFKRRLGHRAYCLVWLDVPADDAAEYVRRFLRTSTVRHPESTDGCCSAGASRWPGHLAVRMCQYAPARVA